MTSENEKEYYSYLKSQFLAGDLVITPKNQKIVQQWNQSRQAGAPINLDVMPPESRDLKVFERLDNLYRIQLSTFGDYYKDSNRAVEKLGCAKFWLDEQYSVYNKCGDATLLSELKKKGIRIGTNLSMKYVGAFAGNLDTEYPSKNIFTIGPAHYCSIFSDYGCVARYGEERHSSIVLKSNVLIIFPLQLYSNNLKTSIEFLLEAEDTVYKNHISDPLFSSRLQLLEKSASYSLDCFLLTDENGGIAFYNKQFESEFNKPLRSSNVNIREFMPELSLISKCLESKKGFRMQEFLLPNVSGKKQAYFVDCLIMTEDTKTIGAKVIFRQAKELKSAVNKYSNYNNAVFTFNDILGKSSQMQKVKNLASKAAESSSNIIITGESGTGKELFAQAIHNASSRSIGPFIPINCGAIPKELIGTELFGYKGGAFTGANRGGSPGKIEEADGGTLFLDEIGEMPLDMQTYLLRFLENGVISRIGSNEYITSNTRIIAATNRNLQKSIEHGTFRLDLFYRLNVISIALPPLREHKDDIEELVKYYVNTLSQRNGKNVAGISPQVMKRLINYDWPGNIRELRNVIERCVIETANGSSLVLALEDSAPQAIDISAFSAPHLVDSASIPNYKNYEETRIRELMLRYNGNKSSVAEAMNISRTTLYKKLSAMGYDK